MMPAGARCSRSLGPPALTCTHCGRACWHQARTWCGWFLQMQLPQGPLRETLLEGMWGSWWYCREEDICPHTPFLSNSLPQPETQARKMHQGLPCLCTENARIMIGSNSNRKLASYHADTLVEQLELILLP